MFLVFQLKGGLNSYRGGQESQTGIALLIKTGYLTDIKFIIVDDNAFMRTIVLRVLRELNAQHIREASDGAEALKLMKTFKPDIAIIDWVMTPMDGIKFTRTIRTSNERYNPFLPIIMMSGYSKQSRIITARDAGINEFLVKPISVKALFGHIQSIIEKPRPFIRTKDFFGPDRRRRNISHIPERRRPNKELSPERDNDNREQTQDHIPERMNTHPEIERKSKKHEKPLPAVGNNKAIREIPWITKYS